MSNELNQAINKQVANWTVMYYKLHNYHWFVKGRHFFVLHEKFEEFYDEAGEYIDELAERLLALGGKPAGTLKECLETASVQEAQGTEKEEQMLQAVIADFNQLISELEQGVELAEKASDDGTADMFIGMMVSLKKHCWMLKAYLE